MELKLGNAYEQQRLDRSNRTFMELKFAFLVTRFIAGGRSNRTFMELK